MTKEIWKEYYNDGRVYYVSNTGKVKRILKNNKVIFIGHKDKRNRVSITIRKKDGKQTMIQVSTLVATLFIPNKNNYTCVDHINRNTLDNSVGNLRWCDHSLNNMNVGKKVRKNKSHSVYKGVTKRKNRAKEWQASIRLSNGKNKHIGTFNTEYEAALAYNKIAKKEYGDFAYLNKL